MRKGFKEYLRKRWIRNMKMEGVSEWLKVVRAPRAYLYKDGRVHYATSSTAAWRIQAIVDLKPLKGKDVTDEDVWNYLEKQISKM